MSEAPIIKAFKELEEGKAFKDWGTQTEKEDTTTSNFYFYIPELVFIGFSLHVFWFCYSQHLSPSGLRDGIKTVLACKILEFS